MGTISEEPKQGQIYLQDDVSGEFDKVLATTKHSSVDTFLEHLMDLYSKASKSTHSVSVRTDIAQRYTALQCETRFQTSTDLMKHLLNLHVEYLKTASNNNTKETRERSVPRKSRKSQPKRNIKHTAILDSEDSGDHLTADASKDAWREVSVSSVEESEPETSEVDLSRVKQEVIDVDDAKVKNSDKDAVRDAGPVCLTLRKPTWAGKSPIEQYAMGNESSIEYNPKSTRQFTLPNWRSQSEPVGRQDAVTHVKQEPMSLQVSPHAESSNSYEVAMQESTAEAKGYDDSSLADDDRLGYNYVLNSFPSSPGDEGQGSNSLPSSPMQMPVQYPKSNMYTISSDEEEAAEDLTISTPDQPHNLSTSKPQIQYAGTKGQDNLVKYDSNANAVPITQFPNGQFISQTPIAIPQNLIFHDQQSSNNLVGQPQVLQFAQSNQGTTVAQMVTSNGKQLLPGNPPPLFVAGMQPLQLVNIRGPPPLTSPVLIRPGLPAPNTNLKFHNNTPQMLAPASSVVTPPNNAAQQSDIASPTSGGQSSDGVSPQQLKRKRKRVDDTTVFRDQQEASLPFNGPNKYRFYCDVCDTGFTRKYTFNRHKCKGRVEKHYCQLCDKAYLSKYKLKDHILVKHEGQTVSCPECGKRFSSRSSMEMHKKQQHEGMYSIFCKICGKGFNHTGHYYGHMNKHTNTKPFWCQQCGKRFYGSSYLHNHKQVCRGNNDLNYSCSICERKFKCELYLKKHMKIHDNTPIISNPNVAKVKDEDLTKAGVKVADPATVNGAVFPENGQPVFPNGPDASDSNSNSNSGALLIDEENSMEIESFSNESAAIATIFKRIFHKNEETGADINNKVQAKKRCRGTNHVTRSSPDVSFDSPEQVRISPELSTNCTESSPVSTTSKQLSNTVVHTKRKTETDTEKKKRKKSVKKKRKKKEVKIESERDDIGFVPDYGSLFEETRVACVNIENVEGHKYEFFTGDDEFSSLIAETNDTYQDIDEIRKIALDREQERQSKKNLQNSNVRYNYDCFKCGKKFRNRAPLNLHIASEHNEDGGIGLLCNDCGKQVDYDHELELHKKFFCRKVKKTFRCMACRLSFITELEKDEHPCTKDPAKPYYCSVQDCQASSRNVKDLTEHVTRHLGIKPFLCNICGRAFSAKKDMDRHADIHRDSKDYVCQICGQSFKSYHTMRRHVFSHKYKDRFKCDLCPYTSAMRNSFNQHMIKHKQRTHKCHICEKHLRSERSLTKHIQNRHTFNRIFTCRYCDFTTDVGLSYSSHMRSHRGLKHVDKTLDTPEETALDLSDHGQAGNEFESLSVDRPLSMTATKLDSNVTLTSTSLLIKCRSDTPMLADAAILGNEEVDISGQNADSIMANIVESSDGTEISVIPPEGSSANLVLYTMEVPASSLNMPTFISDTVTTVSETLNVPSFISDTVTTVSETEILSMTGGEVD